MKRFACAVVCLAVASCSTAPDKISAAYVSPLQYQSYDCDQIQAEMTRLGARVREIAGTQQKEASKDAWATGVGLVLFWPALFFLAGGNDRKEEFSRLKGEYDALESAGIQKKGGFIADIQAQRAAALATPTEEPKKPTRSGRP